MLRRTFLGTPALVTTAAQDRKSAERRHRVAAIVTVYTPLSRADVFLNRVLEGYRLEHISYRPRLELASLYVDQTPANSMAAKLAEEFGFRIYPTIRKHCDAEVQRSPSTVWQSSESMEPIR